MGGLIRLARAALAAGNTRKAARFRLAIEATAQTVAAVPPALGRSLQQLDDKLNELREWKDYVVAPKRAELIEEMEALVGCGEEPAALAEPSGRCRGIAHTKGSQARRRRRPRGSSTRSRPPSGRARSTSRRRPRCGAPTWPRASWCSSDCGRSRRARPPTAPTASC